MENDHKPELQILVARRAKVKASLTRFDSFLKRISLSDITDEIRTEVNARLDKIAPLYSEFDLIQNEIEELEPDKIDKNEQERDEFENRYFSIVTFAKMKLVSPTTQNIPSRSETKIAPESASGDLPSNQTLNVKLPDLVLPEFTGSYDQFISFKEAFDSLINQNPLLTNVQRFFYLRGVLKGEAGKIISSLSASESNYKIAWDLLTQRYQNKKSIINAHMKAIFELPNIFKESHTLLRKMLDEFQTHFRSLRNLGENVDEWNTILIFLLNSKLDSSTRREWEVATKSNTSPTIEEYLKFLTQRCQLLESLDTKVGNANQNAQPKRPSDGRSYSLLFTSPHCPLCNEPHFIYACKLFSELPMNKRLSESKRFNLCSNCLRPGHSNTNCKSLHTCRYCQRRHHSLLHLSSNRSNISNNDHINKKQHYSQARTTQNVNCPAQNGSETKGHNDELDKGHIENNNTNQDSICTHAATSKISTCSSVLLSTAVIKIFDNNGKSFQCRALLDSGSQSNFITKQVFDKLNLTYNHVNIPVSGIGQGCTNISKHAVIKAQSLHNNYTFQLPFLIIDSITGIIPQQRVNLINLKIPNSIQLADEAFNTPSEIDMLLGASIFYELLSFGQIKLGKNLPILNKTKLGWIISGQLPYNSISVSHNFLAVTDPIQTQLQQFWQVEENYASEKPMTNEEVQCETHFLKTFTRDPSGRFVVSLPLKDNYTKLADSEETAIHRYFSIERKLNKNLELKKQYSDFMNEYLSLGHMIEINPKVNGPFPIYYVPHHSVEKKDSTTTKLRVVFDASAKTASGYSLNDVLKVGPTIQSDLFSIILRFRRHEFVLTADLAKMYRQINIKPEERSLQRIVWRNNLNERLSHFELNTVTYGTASAPFLATRCLKQIAVECQADFPIESDVILNDFYVDDLVTSNCSLTELRQIQKNLVNIFRDYGFDLRKFTANDQSLLENIDSNSDPPVKHFIQSAPNSKTLGISYESATDCFVYNSQIPSNLSNSITKRSILSTISQIFDPLGLLGPIIVQAKIILQQLWLAKLNWDDPIPTNLYKYWINFYNLMPNANVLKIPRHALLKDPVNIQLHGFCDASMQAYGACVYIRSEDCIGNIQVTLLCAKSRVAPLKSLTLPRLELAGALLLSKLVKRVTSSLQLNISSTYYWTDSTIVLSWLSAEPRSWKVFVCNRIAEIQNISNINDWNHISTTYNPADIISRGISPTELETSSTWWHGPTFLSKHQDCWPQDCHITKFSRISSNHPELNLKTISLPISSCDDIFKRFSSYIKLIHVLSYCLRFTKRKKLKVKFKLDSLHITCRERQNTELILIKAIQLQCFADDLRSLKLAGSVKPNSNLNSLNPFLDDNGILRVGGRLAHADISFNFKHPVLIPKNHPFTILLIRYTHERNFHSGCQATLSFIRQRFWPLDGSNAVRNVIRTCIICFKANPSVNHNQMGNLPAPRINPSHVFSNCGLDYAGPFLLKDGKYRNKKILKCYVCIFICFATKAVHIELVTELTSECFIAAFKRFVSRRGMCNNLYSDNGSNFIGANNTFKDIYKIISGQPVQNYFDTSQMQWHFIPARSPHFGGLWEASVKSLKYHLKRVLLNKSYTYEEFLTILTQVEAILNSRPIIPLSADPNDLEALTPGHFIIGRPLNAAPQGDVLDISVNRLSKFQQLQKLTQDIWARWKKDYLHNLHQRTKWKFKKETSNLIGSLVILRDDNSLPQQWALGRITQVHPGADGVVRVVNVLTKGGTVKRAITKLSVLPVD